MAEYQTADLGKVFMTAEAIKSARRQSATDALRDQYLGVQIQGAKDQNTRENQNQQLLAQQRQAKQYYLLADGIVRERGNIDFIRQFAPEFIENHDSKHGAGSFEKLTPEQIIQEASGMKTSLGAYLGLQPKFSNPEPGVQNGKEVFFQTDESGNPQVLDGIAPRPQKRSGISMTTPDGTTVTIGDDGVPNYGGNVFSKPTRTKLEDAFVNAQGNSYALREQLAKYRPEFSTFAGKMKAGVADLKEQAGLANAPQQQQFLADFTTWKSDTARLLSQYLNQLSGAAISPHEEARLKAGFPNADDGPTQYQSKAQATMRNFALVQARAAYLLSNPAQSLDSVSLDSMSNIIAGEANRLAKALESGGMAADQARQEAIAKTRSRYGLNDAQ